ncbi:MAG: hypothetical protein FJY07_09340 [Bacteroidetes bacterium]|nr:hypothetical protein [Bacteroidota bacterium]
MKNIKRFSALIATLLMTGTMQSQNISISDVSHSADASAVLDVYSTSLGALLPRLTTSARTGISSPATGLTVYDTDTDSYWFYDGSNWTELSYGNLWKRDGANTLTYLSNTGDDVVIGSTSNPSNFRFYVYGASPQISRFDGKVEYFNVAGGSMLAEIDKLGAANDGIINIYDGAGLQRISLYSGGKSFFNGGFFGIGTGNPFSLLHVRDNTGTVAAQVQIQNNSAAGAGNTSVNYKTSSLALDYSEGIDNTESSFKLCNTAALVSPSAQSDASTMYRAFNSGIIDFNNQSRSRAYQKQNMALFPGAGQVIPFAIWTPIDFDVISYDEQMEFTLAVTPPYSPGGGPAAAFFTATEDGYYQVNSRTDFWMRDPETGEYIFTATYPGHVSIAIAVTNLMGMTNMYAQGNKLQGATVPLTQQNTLENNLAPNVSDVVYLHKGESISIWAWQDLYGGGLPLRVGPFPYPGLFAPVPSQTYVSIHKSS